MAIRGKRKEMEFYFKIVELRLIQVVRDSVKSTNCIYQAALYKDKEMADLDDNNSILRTEFISFQLGQGNNFQQQAYDHLRTYLADDFIEDVLENGQGLKTN